MDYVLRQELWRRCLIYIDDIIIFSKSFEAHLEHPTLFFQKMEGANLKLKASKCSFVNEYAKFWGHVVTRKGVKPNRENLDVIKTYPQTKFFKKVKSFMGLASYYRRLIKGFSEISAPLHQLTNTRQTIHWDQTCENAFQLLKSKHLAVLPGHRRQS